jgi:hypothetical protein
MTCDKEVETMEAEAFTTFPGKCFRFVEAPNGRRRHCPNPATHTGRFTDSKGVVWTVDACAEHVEDPQFHAAVEAKGRKFRIAPGVPS